MARIPFTLELRDIQFSAIRAQGAGGQNVNKVSSAVMARLDVRASSLPQRLKERVLALQDQRLSEDGVIVIKAQEHRSQPQNRAAAIARLQALLDAAAHLPTVRVATRPTLASRRRRLDEKSLHGQRKAARRSTDEG